MNKTTVAHIIVSRLGMEINYPRDIKGDLEKEQTFLLMDDRGPKLLVTQRAFFENVCREIDYCIEEGVAEFDDGSGIITMKIDYIFKPEVK